MALEAHARKGSYIDFITVVTEFQPEISLIYQLLINEKTVETIEDKTFMDFDYTFLNSEALIFKQILRLASANDSLTGRINALTLKLLRSAFKPITFTLNLIIFQ